MNIIVCLDLNNGMCFNKRRQSRDSKVIHRILELTKNFDIYIEKYSEALFPLPCSRILIKSVLQEYENPNAYCFVERSGIIKTFKNINKIVVYRWDKVYPQDEKFPLNLNEWNLESSNVFQGSSHEKITEEVYVK